MVGASKRPPSRAGGAVRRFAPDWGVSVSCAAEIEQNTAIRKHPSVACCAGATSPARQGRLWGWLYFQPALYFHVYGRADGREFSINVSVGKTQYGNARGTQHGIALGVACKAGVLEVL